MATGNDNGNIGTNNGTMNFSNNPSVQPGVFGYMQGNATKKQFNNDFWKEGGYLSESIKELETIKQQYKDISKYSDLMTKAEQKALKDKKTQLNQQLALLQTIRNEQDVSDTEAINAIDSSNKLKLKGQQDYIKTLNLIIESQKDADEEHLGSLDNAIAKYNQMKKTTEDTKTKLKQTSKVLSKSSDSFSDSLSKTLKNAGDKLSDLSNMFNLQSLANNSMEQNARSKASIMGSVSRQFGFTSNSQFEGFKNSLNDTIKSMNSEMGNLFNSEDLKTYMANLSDYGVTDTKLAEQQMKSSVIATKYLGVSTETQTEIFKYMKRTNNNEALEKNNKTIVGLMKSQLGVSKDQLDALSKIAYTSANDLSAIGMSDEAQAAYIPTTQASGAVLSSQLNNSDTAKALQQMYADFLNSGMVTDTEKWGALLGGNMQSIYNSGFNATTEEGQAKAMSDFYSAIQNSGVFNNASNPQAMKYFNQRYGLTSDEVNGIKTMNTKDYYESVLEALKNIDSTTSSDVTDTIQQTQESTWLEKLFNVADTFMNDLPWKLTMNLANAAFIAYLASGAVKLFGSLTKFIGTSGGFTAKLGAMLGGNAAGGTTAATAGITKLAGFLGNPVTLIAAITAAVFAGANAWNKSVSSSISNKAVNDFKNSDSKYASNTSAQAIRGLTAGNGNKEGRNWFGKTLGDVGQTGGAIGLMFSKMGTGISNWSKEDGYKFNDNYVSQNKSFYENMLASSITAQGKDADKYTLAYAYLLDEVDSLASLEGVNKSYLKDYVKNGDFKANNIQSIIDYMIEAGWSPEGRDMKKATGVNTIDRYLKNGLAWIPKDNFIAQLHKGEMVLNAQDAAAYREATGVGPYGYGGESDALYKQGIRGRLVTGLPWVMTAGYGKYPTINRQHRGLDFGISVGTPVGAAYSGTVDSTTSGWGGGFGNSVYVRGNNGVYYRYAHLSSVKVKNGQNISAGDTIGLSGNTGNSTGPHLHFQTDKPYGSTNDINPYGYVTSSLFQSNGDVSMGNNGTTSTTGTSSQMASIPVSTRKFIPKAFSAATEGQGGAVEPIVNSVDGGFNKLISYLDSIREEQSAQRAIISAFSKSRVSESSF